MVWLVCKAPCATTEPSSEIRSPNRTARRRVVRPEQIPTRSNAYYVVILPYSLGARPRSGCHWERTPRFTIRCAAGAEVFPFWGGERGSLSLHASTEVCSRRVVVDRSAAQRRKPRPFSSSPISSSCSGPNTEFALNQILTICRAHVSVPNHDHGRGNKTSYRAVGALLVPPRGPATSHPGGYRAAAWCRTNLIGIATEIWIGAGVLPRLRRPPPLARAPFSR